jgi:hypothetical protein
MHFLRWLCRSGLVAILFVGPASAQFNFQLTLTENGNAVLIPNNASLAFNAPVGQTQTARITAIYVGSGQVVISQLPQLFGSNAFTANFTPKLPLTITNGNSFSFDLQFHPTSSTQANATLNLPYVETITGPAPTFAQIPTQGTINLQLQGTAPSIVLSYILQADLNVVTVQPGGSIMFPASPINTTAQATFNISNRGSGPAQINGITFAGPAFKVSGLPLFPVTIASGQNLQVLVQYMPTSVNSDTGQIQIAVDPNTTLTVGLQGNGTSTASAFSYQVLQGASSTPVAPGGTISLFPDTNVGEMSSLSFQVQNTGTAPGTISSINVTPGNGFQLSDLPALPQTLAPNASLAFTVTFAPTVPKSSSARLMIGSDTFTLSALGLGPNLTFSYILGGATVKVPANGAVVFSPVMITKTSELDFVVNNTGTFPATISNIGIGEQNSPFSLSGLPTLPVTIDPNTDLHFTIRYTPVTTGFSTGTLRLDTIVVGLTGSGTAPPPLPSYTIQGPTGNVDPQSQPSIGLKLSSPYPIAVSGVLTMSISTDLVVDPATQFASGGRTVQFVIPANSTDAVFAGGGTQIRLQPGTVASTITLIPSFSTQAGGVDLTPNSLPVLQFTVASAAPVLIAGQATNVTANSFTLVVTGFSTTRSLTALNVQFTPAAGFNVPQAQFTIDLHQPSTVWFQSGNSRSFGGQFVVNAPFSFQGTVPAGQSVLQSISSLIVTATNSSGVSNSLQAIIH